MKKSKFSPPKRTADDIDHLVAKNMLSPILAPIWGANSLFEYIFSSPLEKRKNEWMDYVGGFLQQNFGDNLENLASNEKFITIFIQATRVAAQNHQEEKLESLRNAVVSSVYTQDISEDLQLTFIRFIDELTPSHILLLKFFTSHLTVWCHR